MPSQVREALRLHLLSSDKTGREWDVVVIASGPSKNGTRYPAETLKAAVSLFEGVPVCAYQFSDPEAPLDHLPDRARAGTGGDTPILNAVGVLSGARYGTYDDPVTGQRREGILARLKIGEAFTRLRSWMKTAFESASRAFGFSIDGQGDVEEDGTVSRLESISELTLVTHPAAGGTGLRIVASLKEQSMFEKLLALLRESAPELLKGLDEKTLKESDVLELLGKMAKAAKAAGDPPAGAPPAAAPMTIDAFLASLTPEQLQELAAKVAGMIKPAAAPAEPMESAEAKATRESFESLKKDIEIHRSSLELEKALGASKLADISKARVRESMKGRALKADEIAAAVKAEAEYVDGLTKSGRVIDMGLHEGAQGGVERKDRLRIALYQTHGVRLSEADAKIAREQGVKPFKSLRRMFEQLEGDIPFERVVESYHAKGRRLHEGLVTGDWTDIFRDAQNKSFIQDYGRTDAYSIEDAKKIARFVSVPNIHPQYVITEGGFANLGTVPQGSNYPELDMYGDVSENFTPTKKGGMAEITEETIWQDDLNAVARMPAKLGESARRTLYEFIFDMFTANAVLAQDSVAWFDDTYHVNLLTTAISQAAILAAQLVIRTKTQADSSKRLGLLARVILVPYALEGSAKALVRAEGQTDKYDPLSNPNTIRQLPDGSAWDVVPVTHWTDLTDWYLCCDSSVGEVIRVGFLNGKEEPELWVQDDPKGGARFAADKILYKVRHVYGGCPVDWRTAMRHTVT